MRDILPERYPPGEPQKSREALLKSKRIAKLRAVPETGIMGDAAHFDIYYRGSIWYFAEGVSI
jgi:hypothetical protein